MILSETSLADLAAGRTELRDSDLPPELMNELAELCQTPAGFAMAPTSMGGLGMPDIYDWQADVLNWFRKASPTVRGALCTPNGAGKSSGVVAALASWWMAIYQKGKVVITTNSQKQLDGQLIPALDLHLRKIPGIHIVTSPVYRAKTTGGGMLTAFTTNEGDRAEGWHKHDDLDGPLLIIVDEAKSVERTIFEAIDRCTYNGLLYVSSPGLMNGTFYEAFSKNKAWFKTRTVSLLECPHKKKADIDYMIGKHGINHPLVQSSVYGQFMEQDSEISYVFPLLVVNRALESPPMRQRAGGVSAFCDFAAGGDENVLAHREGNVVRLADCWRDTDTVKAVLRFNMKFRQLGLVATEIFGDEGGLGKPMIDQLRELGQDINRVNNNDRAYDQVYENRASEIWHETAAAMRRGEIVLDGEGIEELKEQLTSRRSVVTNQGTLAVESKDKMKKRGLKSPDRADAFCGAWSCRAQVQTQSIGEMLDEYQMERESEQYPPGCDPGC